MANHPQRKLHEDFVADLQANGFMNPILEVVKADDTLSLNVRRDSVNIYYRGGSLLRIDRRASGDYRLCFDEKYCDVDRGSLGSLPLVACGNLPRAAPRADRATVDTWVASIPLLKSAMDIWLGLKGHRYEREFQQLIERSNNGNYATDYFVCDIEYAHVAGKKKQQFDMVAVLWPVRDRHAGSRSHPKLVLVEVKFREAAIGGDTSGIVRHVEKLGDAIGGDPDLLADLAEEMRLVFNQRMKLGLIECHKDGTPRQIEQIDSETPEYIILLADHYPASTELNRAIGEVSRLQPQLPFCVKIATANFMGYGLYSECVIPLDEFGARYQSQIHSRSTSAAADRGPGCGLQETPE